MTPDIDPVLGIAHGVSPGEVERTLQAHADARALLLVNPTSFGVAPDLRQVVELARRRSLPVLVDEAHEVGRPEKRAPDLAYRFRRIARATFRPKRSPAVWSLRK